MNKGIESQPIRPLIVRRYFFGLKSHIELECGHDRSEHTQWAGAEIASGEAARCFDCEMVAAGLMPTEAQLTDFRSRYATSED